MESSKHQIRSQMPEFFLDPEGRLKSCVQKFPDLNAGFKKVFSARTLGELIENLENLIETIHSPNSPEPDPTVFYLEKQINLILTILNQASENPLIVDALLKMKDSFKGEENRGVRYLNAEEREQYRVIPYDGMLWQIRNKDNRFQFMPFDTRNPGRFNVRKDNLNIFVIDPITNHLFFGDESQFNHSSFVYGGDVPMAGEAIVEAGKIVYLSNRSGHYEPNRERFYQSIYHFYNLGLLAHNVRLKEEASGENITLAQVLAYFEKKKKKELSQLDTEKPTKKKETNRQEGKSEAAPLKSKKEAKTSNQKKLDELQKLLYLVIDTLERKNADLPTNHPDKSIISEILGTKTTVGTLYQLNERINNHKKNPAQITQDSIQSFASDFQQIARQKILENQGIQKHQTEETFFQRLGRRVLDGLKRFVSQHYMDHGLSATGLFHDVGKYSLKKLSVFTHEIKGKYSKQEEENPKMQNIVLGK